MNKPSDYRAIRVWHASTGSFSYYWKHLQELAAEEGAPLNAIYKTSGGTWITTNDLSPGHPFLDVLKETYLNDKA